MGKTVQVRIDLLESLRDALCKQAAERDSARAEVAALQQDLEVYRGVMALVEDGLVDPADMTEKVAEYRTNPESIALVKQAAALGFGSADVGALDHTGTGDSASGASAEARLITGLRTALNPE